MSLKVGSRYEGLTLFVYKDEKGRTRKCLNIRHFISLEDINGNAKYITKRNGDCLDLIAIKNGANREEQWYLIADINNVEKPLEIDDGSELIIPNESVFQRF